MGLFKKWIIKKYLEQPGNLAYYDQLCGCYNRNYFELVVKIDIQLWINKYITIIDINSFKKINDVYGHRIGDASLKNVVDVINNFLKKDDIIIRYGGDEFIVIANELDFDQINEILTNQYNVSISYGTADSSAGYSKSIDSFVDKADKLMYKMKQEYYSRGNQR